MKKEEILVGNKLIAEFIGAIHNGGSYYKFKENLPNFKTNDWIETDLRFHSSWDWLIPAYNKARVSSYKVYDSFDVDKAHIKLWKGFNVKNNKIDITRVFKSLVSYIKWYNKYKQKNK